MPGTDITPKPLNTNPNANTDADVPAEQEVPDGEAAPTAVIPQPLNPSTPNPKLWISKPKPRKTTPTAVISQPLNPSTPKPQILTLQTRNAKWGSRMGRVRPRRKSPDP